MEISTAVVLAIVLLIGLWVPSYVWYIRSGRAHGHTWFTWWKPRVIPILARMWGESVRLDPAQTMGVGRITEIVPLRHRASSPRRG